MKGKTKSDNLSEEWEDTLKNKSSGEKYGSPRIWWDSKKRSMLDFLYEFLEINFEKINSENKNCFYHY